MFKRSLLIGCLWFPSLTLAQDDSITLSHIKFCYYLWGSAAICESKSAWVTENEMIQFRELCDRIVQKKYGYIPDNLAHMKRQSAYEGASETFNSDSFENRCSLTKTMIVNLLTTTGPK